MDPPLTQRPRILLSETRRCVVSRKRRLFKRRSNLNEFKAAQFPGKQTPV